MSVEPREVLSRPASEPDLVVSYGPLPEHVADVRLPVLAQAGRPEGGPTPGGPAPGRPAPLVLVIHGGFWRSEWDRAHTGPMCADLAARGYASAAIEFRRTGATHGGWPATFDDVAAATDRVPHLVAAAASGQVDVANVVLMGHSAGGHLALWAAGRHRVPVSQAARLWRRPTPLPVRGVVALAPVAVLESASRAQLGVGAVDDLLGGSPDQVPDRYDATDPVRLLPTGGRTVIVHGERDDLVPIANAQEYVARASAAGDDATLRMLHDIEHFGLIDPLSPAWPTVLDAIAAILSENA